MQVTLKYSQVEETLGFFEKLLEKSKKTDSNVKLSNVFSLKIFRLHKTLAEEYDVFRTKIQEIRDEHLEKDENGNPKEFENENGEKSYKIVNNADFTTEIQKLYSETVDINISMPISVEELDDENMDLTDYSEMKYLDPFIK